MFRQCQLPLYPAQFAEIQEKALLCRKAFSYIKFSSRYSAVPLRETPLIRPFVAPFVRPFATPLISPFFTPFLRHSPSPSSIAHSAAAQMRGSLTAQNSPEGGACFTLTLLQSPNK